MNTEKVKRSAESRATTGKRSFPSKVDLAHGKRIHVRAAQPQMGTCATPDMCEKYGCTGRCKERSWEKNEMDNTPQIGMDQLSYFVNMMKNYLDPDRSKRFWKQIHEDCPELMQAIDASFAPASEWREITFTWSRISPAFDPNLVFGDEEQPEQREQLPGQLEPGQESRI
jgi:hypothetical protein